MHLTGVRGTDPRTGTRSPVASDLTPFFAAPTPATRKVALRSAIIFSPDRGGPFALLSRLVRLGLGGASGSGRQFVSWIHDRDFVRAVDLLLTGDSWTGVVNLAAPDPLPNRAFMQALRDAWAAPVGLPAAGWMIGAAGMLLRTESELVLKSRRVIPGRLLDAGFQFQFPEWPAAARDLVSRYRTGPEAWIPITSENGQT